MARHIHSGGLIGGYSVCGSARGECTDDWETIDCLECARMLANAFKLQPPNWRYRAEAQRALSKFGLTA